MHKTEEPELKEDQDSVQGELLFATAETAAGGPHEPWRPKFSEALVVLTFPASVPVSERPS